MVEYIEEPELKERAIAIAKRLNLAHIDFDRVYFYSYSCETRTCAKITGFFKTLQLAYPHIRPFYVITFNNHNFLRENEQQQNQTILHELLHIPKTFSGEFSKIAHSEIYRKSRLLI
ncbi:MAG: putative metallopeptidase [Candidatus Nanoarchaeia archaeon]|nr:putative metallopeptidase [Candidatus Nanoarchaeia archaeon]